MGYQTFNLITMPKKPSRKSPEKDENGGKLGQFTTEVAKTIAKAKEEQKRESAQVFMGELERAQEQYRRLLDIAKQEYNAQLRKLSAVVSPVNLTIGIVIGSALTAILLSV